MTIKRHVVKNLTLNEISGVTIPAQSHALVAMMKGEDTELVKYLTAENGAVSFGAFMADQAARDRINAIDSKLWPITSALRDSLTSILADASLNDDEREEKIAESVAQFSAACQRIQVSAIDLMKLLNHEDHMSDELKKVAELEASVAELTKKLAEAESLSKLSDDEKEHLASLKDEDAAKFKAADSETRKKLMKKSAEGDEVFKSADGHEIRKSVVGDGVFAILKSQADAIKATRDELVKTAERAQAVELTKRAEDELSNLPGETVAKVAVLKGVASLDEATQATLNAMLKAGNEALAKGFQTFGVGGGKPSDLTKAAKRDELIKAHMTANPTVTKAQAEVAIISAHPDLYEG